MHDPRVLIYSRRLFIRVWVLLRSILFINSVAVHRFVRPQLREFNHTSAIVLHSSLFLLVFLIRRQGLAFSARSIVFGRLITRGDVVLRLRGLERAVLKPDRFVCRLRPNQLTKNLSEDREPLFTSSGISSGAPSGSHYPLVLFSCSSYRPQKSQKKISPAHNHVFSLCIFQFQSP